MKTSRLPGFFELSVADRRRVLASRGFLEPRHARALEGEALTLDSDGADRMIENVVGVFGLPFAAGLNLVVNGRDVVAPLVVEEPSIVAALSATARVVRGAGGVLAHADVPKLVGQVQLLDVPDPGRAREAILTARGRILAEANRVHPKMVARGGGAEDVEVRVFDGREGRGAMVVVYLVVDTRDAMGANAVNGMCEGVARLLEHISGGRALLRILSNLTDRALVRATVRMTPDLLARGPLSGEEVRDGIVAAGDLAVVDPYRAATHNKGIMNGVDAVAIATGNDWRAIEAAAHAFAASTGQYRSLTDWSVDGSGALVGTLRMPLKVGVVGGNLQSNPMAEVARRMAGVRTARELAEVMAAVGLLQNLAALRALVGEGIQRGHMKLHARSVALAAGAGPAHFDRVVARLVASGEIKLWKAREILDEIEAEEAVPLHNARPALQRVAG